MRHSECVNFSKVSGFPQREPFCSEMIFLMKTKLKKSKSKQCFNEDFTAFHLVFYCLKGRLLCKTQRQLVKLLWGKSSNRKILKPSPSSLQHVSERAKTNLQQLWKKKVKWNAVLINLHLVSAIATWPNICHDTFSC